MKLRDLQDTMGDALLGRLMVSLGVLRTMEQKEPCTFDGECEATLEWLDTYGLLSEDTYEIWLCEVGDTEVPDSVIQSMLDARDNDKESA